MPTKCMLQMSQSHCQCAAANPGNAAAAFSGANALRDLDGDVRADRGDYD